MQKGFSLVELSIVLVILGLLTGGILAGQSLIRAAEIRSISADMLRYQSAIYTFRSKYMALPGDMTNATSFWGAAGGTGTGSACFTVASTSTATCNGNGDGMVDTTAGAASGDIWFYGERFHVWNHLANAGLIQGSYTGVTDSATNNIVRTSGKNEPSAKLPNTVFEFVSFSFTSSAYFFSTYLTGSIIHDLAFRPNYGGAAPLTPEEAWGVDLKLDDGKPGLGQVFTHKKTSTSFPDCATSDTAATAEYDVATKTKLCVLDFTFGR